MDPRFDHVLPDGQIVYGRRGLGDAPTGLKVVAWLSVAAIAGGALLVWWAWSGARDDQDFAQDSIRAGYRSRQIDEDEIVTARGEEMLMAMREEGRHDVQRRRARATRGRQKRAQRAQKRAA